MLWFLACVSTETPTVAVPKKQILFAKGSQKQEMTEFLEAKGYEVKGEFSGAFYYALLQQPIATDLAIDMRAQSFRIIHVQSGVEALGKQQRSAQDVWSLYSKFFDDKVSHTVAYGGAPWFIGGTEQRVSLVKQLGRYFYGLEARDAATPFASASPLVFAGEIKGDAARFLSDSDLGMECTVMDGFSSVYWCEAPELNVDCLTDTEKWIETLWSLNLTHTTEGKYRSVFRDQKIRLCLPSGCYDCDGIGCKNNASSEGLPVHIDQTSWSLCVEKNFDDDPERTRFCFTDQSYAKRELGVYVDDCRL